MGNNNTLNINKKYWDTNADYWFGATALPEYGVQFVTEDELHFFGDVTGKKMLEIGCGSGHSLNYNAERNAGELWGLDISASQLENAKKYLNEKGHYPKLICSPMEAESGIPTDYFDFVYSIYAIGWTTDLVGTFKRIASYLKNDGVLIFSWQHPLHGCVFVEDDKLIFKKSYFNEEYFTQQVHGCDMKLSIRKISTYINALSEAGFLIEQMVEQTDKQTLDMTEDMTERSKKAQMLPLSFVFKARKRILT
jgi:SAM-dependent methyltransferase